MRELRYAGTAVAPCDAPQTLWRLSAISSSAASARRPCAPRPPPSRLPLTAPASFAPVLAPWHPFVAAGRLPARHALIHFSMILRLFSGRCAQRSAWETWLGRAVRQCRGLDGAELPSMGAGWDHPAAGRCRCRLGVHVASRRLSCSQLGFGKHVCLRASVRVCHGREILVLRCERIM